MHPILGFALLLDQFTLASILFNASQMPLFAHEQGSIAATGIIIICLFLFTCTQRWIWPALIRHYGIDTVLSISQLGSAVCLVVLAFLYHYITDFIGLLGVAVFRVNQTALMYAMVLCKTIRSYDAVVTAKSVWPHVGNALAILVYGLVNTVHTVWPLQISLLLVAIAHVGCYIFRRRDVQLCQLPAIQLISIADLNTNDGSLYGAAETELRFQLVRSDHKQRIPFVRWMGGLTFLLQFSQSLLLAMFLFTDFPVSWNWDFTGHVAGLETAAAFFVFFVPHHGAYIFLFYFIVLAMGYVLAVGASVSDLVGIAPLAVVSLAYIFLSLIVEIPFYLGARMTERSDNGNGANLSRTPDEVRRTPRALYSITIWQEWAIMTAVAIDAWMPSLSVMVLGGIQLAVLMIIVIIVVPAIIIYQKGASSVSTGFTQLTTRDPSSFRSSHEKEKLNGGTGPKSDDGDEKNEFNVDDLPKPTKVSIDPEQAKELDLIMKQTPVPPSLEKPVPLPLPPPPPEKQTMVDIPPPPAPVPVASSSTFTI